MKNSQTGWQKHPTVLTLLIAGTAVLASGALFTLAVNCMSCPNGPIELCTCVINGLMIRNLLLVIGGSVVAVGGIIHLIQTKTSS